jgi:hypothetical protein
MTGFDIGGGAVKGVSQWHQKPDPLVKRKNLFEIKQALLYSI